MTRRYRYIGDAAPASLGMETARASIHTGQDVIRWIRETEQSPDREGEVTATFIVDIGGVLWIADRRSEHVQCARGGDVLAAGEMTFAVDRHGVSVSSVTNQSTGYCPEPGSWVSVRNALALAGLAHPSGYTPAFVFRRCEACGMRNLVKDAWFECGVCGEALPQAWNCGHMG